MMIMDEIDTGDLLFYKYDCSECLKLPDMMKCYANKIFNEADSEYEGVGVAVRHGAEVAVIYERDNQILSEWYSTFLSSPFHSELILRKFKVLVDDPEFSKLFAKRVLLLDH